MKTCEHIHSGSIGPDGADLILCGKPAKKAIDMKGGAYGGRRRDLVPVCGVHARFWTARGYEAKPLVAQGGC